MNIKSVSAVQIHNFLTYLSSAWMSAGTSQLVRKRAQHCTSLNGSCSSVPCISMNSISLHSLSKLEMWDPSSTSPSLCTCWHVFDLPDLLSASPSLSCQCFGSAWHRFPLEEEMATHSSILAWETPWTEEPGRLQTTESQRVRYDLATQQQEAIFGHSQVAQW